MPELVGVRRLRSAPPRRPADVSEHLSRSGPGWTFVDAELHLVQPAMYGIGKGWQENRISVAHEHMATALVHGLLAREFATAESLAAQWPERGGRGRRG